jgi:radical SAM protein with 4Fe4S-binding SPASM domain
MHIPFLDRKKPATAKAYCTAPFTSLVVDPNKNVRPCCTFEGSLGNLERDSLSDILSGPQWTEVRHQIANGETPKGCAACYEREKATGWSVRLCHYDPEQAQTDQWRHAITQMEINSTNVCNLACTHCSEEFSSRWVPLNEKLGRDMSHRNLMIGQRTYSPNPENMVQQLSRLDLTTLEQVRFKGGEPMLNHDVPAVLEHLLERGLLKNVTVLMVTNGSTVNEKVLSLLRNARHVDMCISVDGTGAVQDYIRRGPSGIPRIERFIAAVEQSLPRLRFLTSVSVMAYNVFSLDRIAEWWNGFRATRPDLFPPLAFGLHVVDPPYLSVNVLQDSTREQLAAKYRRLSNADYSCVLQSLAQPFSGVALHNEFVRFTRDMDKVWNSDVLQAVPELAAEMALLPATTPQERTWVRISPDAASEADVLRQGLSLSEAGMHADALQLYDGYLEATRKPIATTWEICLHRAIVLGRLGEWDRSHEALYGLASVAPERTLEAMQRMLEHRDAPGRAVLSGISQHLGTQTGFVESPSFPLLMEGLAYRALDNHPEAIASVGRALSLDPEFALAKVAKREISAAAHSR